MSTYYVDTIFKGPSILIGNSIKAKYFNATENLVNFDYKTLLRGI